MPVDFAQEYSIIFRSLFLSILKNIQSTSWEFLPCTTTHHTVSTLWPIYTLPTYAEFNGSGASFHRTFSKILYKVQRKTKIFIGSRNKNAKFGLSHEFWVRCKPGSRTLSWSNRTLLSTWSIHTTAAPSGSTIITLFKQDLSISLSWTAGANIAISAFSACRLITHYWS